jgi:hypothetical protein
MNQFFEENPIRIIAVVSWRVTGQDDINLEIRKREFRRKEDGEYKTPLYYGNLKEIGRQEDLRPDGEDQSSKKRVEKKNISLFTSFDFAKV